jgi:hypothetical protein
MGRFGKDGTGKGDRLYYEKIACHLFLLVFDTTLGLKVTIRA